MESTAKVQHLTKASSEELLRKFAEVGSEKEDRKEIQLAKRIKKSSNRKATKFEISFGSRMYVDQSVNLIGINASVVERKSLLGSVVVSSQQSQRSFAFGRNRTFGIGKAKIRARNAIEKTWRRTIEGATKIFMEKQYNRHKRLPNDLY